MEWHDLINNVDNNPEIEAINSQLINYNSAYRNREHTQDHLNQIISACEKFITKIPPDERASIMIAGKDWKSQVYEKYPYLEKVLNIQKQAVIRLFLPKATDDTKARWSLIRQLVVSDVKTKSFGPGKMLHSDYWSEFTYKGSRFINQWISENNYDSNHYIRSYGEILKRKEKAIGIGKDIEYIEEKQPYKLSFNDGKVYRSNNQKLDTSSAASAVHNLTGQVLYATGLDGSVYISDPNKRIGTDFHHSSLLGGKSVLCAGTMKVINGEIKLITIESGHYRPDKKDLINFLKVLQNTHNIDLKNVKVRDNKNKVTSATRLLSLGENCLSDKEYATQFKDTLKKIRNKLTQHNYTLHYGGTKVGSKKYPDTAAHIIQTIGSLLPLKDEKINQKVISQTLDKMTDELEEKSIPTYGFFGVGARDKTTTNLYKTILSDIKTFIQETSVSARPTTPTNLRK